MSENKYQDALNRIVDDDYNFPHDHYEEDKATIKERDIETLQELVDKATLKKVIEDSFTGYGEVEFTAFCPKCNVNLGYASMNFYKCCPKCGQALDWSEEDE